MGGVPISALERQDRMDLDGSSLRSRILGRPRFRLRAVLALQDEVAIEPWGLLMHRSVRGLGLTIDRRNAKACCGRLARVAVLESTRGLHLVEVFREGVDLLVQLG